MTRRILRRFPSRSDEKRLQGSPRRINFISLYISISQPLFTALSAWNGLLDMSQNSTDFLNPSNGKRPL